MSPPPPTNAAVRADWRFALKNPVHLLALGFGAGLSPIAPGTAGSLLGWAGYLLLAPWLSNFGWAALLLGGFMLGGWACGRTARALRTDDPSAVVWDEIIAIWLVLWLLQSAPGAPAAWWLQAAGFALFRLFDAVKRGPVGWADKHIKGGVGIMFDDLVAALLTLGVLFGARLALLRGFGHGV
ncbi:phosphatidylglycerophosphatase A [Thiomonas sp.]|uniref:phosphatidylglycerophosphatase A family protein n=1 Tax=Thiomonas sp. TaxID=2047785 RepID=UPI00258A3066|nr:phosphatidylglycerophosphatase A [Thiomonas sp.]